MRRRELQIFNAGPAGVGLVEAEGEVALLRLHGGGAGGAENEGEET